MMLDAGSGTDQRPFQACAAVSKLSVASGHLATRLPAATAAHTASKLAAVFR
jgi:hypothetical protein